MKKSVSLLLVIFMLFSFIVPVKAMDNPIRIRLTKEKSEITTKHIECIDVESANQTDEEKTFDLVFQLLDYKGRILNYTTSEEILEGNEITNTKTYMKILEKAYKVKIFACKDLDFNNAVSNVIEIPIADGYFVEEIESIDDLKVNISKGDEYKLPTEVLAKMNTGKTKNFPVTWNVKNVDTSKRGEFVFEGTVKGYPNKVKLNLTIEGIDSSEVITFENEELEAIVREEIFKEDGDILGEDILQINNLNLSYGLYGDSNINDLKYFENLETLDLSFNGHKFDLKPISNLKNLQSLNLFGNAIEDITPLKSLVNLQDLNLGENNITDIKSLCSLENLTKLKLSGNSITDYSPTINYYDKLGTEGKDFNLTILEADADNTITYKLELNKDVTLPYGIKLANGNKVFVDWDKKEINGSSSRIEKVRGKVVGLGTEVIFKCIIGNESEDRIINFPDKNLEKSVRMAIDKNKGDIYYSDVVNLKSLDIMAVGVKDLTGIDNLKGLEHLSLWGNGIESSQLKHLKGLTNLKELDLALNKLTYIPAKAFENMSKLEELVLDENQIREIDKDAFRGLENLQSLLIEENQITNIESVKELKNLKTLFMRYNRISDISIVGTLAKLEELWASNNNISNITPLSSLKELKWVNIEDNNISDISPLANSTKIYRLKLNGNKIKNIDVVSNMKDLEWLEVNNNQIENIDCVSELVKLQILDLKNNKVSNINALYKIRKLTQLYLAGNNITDFSPVSEFYDDIKRKDFELN